MRHRDPSTDPLDAASRTIAAQLLVTAAIAILVVAGALVQAWGGWAATAIVVTLLVVAVAFRVRAVTEAAVSESIRAARARPRTHVDLARRGGRRA
jgi:hypothetical protein